MRMFRMRWIVAALLGLLLGIVLAGCQAAPQVIVVTATPAPAAGLQIVGATVTKTLSFEEIKALPAVEGWAGIKSSTGKITPPTHFKGVAVQDLCALVGTFDDTVAANIVAKDGYAMTFSYDQVTGGAFTTFDPATGDEVARDEKLSLIVAYEQDGKPIPEESDGALRLVIISPEKNQVTDGHWAVKWVRQVVVKPAAAEWTLHLEGALVEDMDRATFESGSAPNCHLAEWTDANGDKWGGIPLYLLLGRVDDQIKHEAGAFNADLAAKGYKVDIVAADGYKATFDSQRLNGNKAIILANLMNDKPLPEDYFPLRLVGAELQKNEMVGAVAQVVLHLDQVGAGAGASATVTATEAAASGAPSPVGTLRVIGKVTTELAVTQADLKGMPVLKMTLEHPKKGQVEYEGVRVKHLRELSEPKAEATVAVLTAGDGYAAEVPMEALTACLNCLVVPDGEGFSLAMPGMDSSAWVKDVRTIEFK